ncbi:MAG: type II toxin-antitoxin system RelE/ParE family toxin [Acidobacteriota bacterium]
MRLSYSREAVEDLERLRDFIAEKSPPAAAPIAERLIKGIEKLKTFPRLGHPVEKAPDPDRIRDVLVGDYVVRYLLLDRSALILRIWHQLENWPESPVADPLDAGER